MVINRSYLDVLARAKVDVEDITRGLTLAVNAEVLIHSEDAGRPHCLAARREGTHVVFWNHGQERRIAYADMMACFADATDQTSVVTMTLQPREQDQNCTIQNHH